MFFKPSNDAALSPTHDEPGTEKRRLTKAVAAQDGARLAAALRNEKGSSSPVLGAEDAGSVH